MQFLRGRSVFHLLVIFIVLGVASTLSFFSGYQAHPTSPEIRFLITPLGLIFYWKKSLLALSSQCIFSGVFHPYSDYLIVFLKTCVLELPFYFLVFRNLGPWIFSSLFLGNLLTHPIVFFGFPCVFSSYIFNLLASELFAPTVEICFILGLNRLFSLNLRISTVVSLILFGNLFSWQMSAWV